MNVDIFKAIGGLGGNGGKLKHFFVNETLTRTANRTISFTGTIRYVGVGQTYSTISAAYAASTSGDIIQLVDGEYLMNVETSGYLLLNTTNKRILIRGNASNRAAVILRQTSAVSYFLRLRYCGETVFQNLTIISDQNLRNIYIDGDYVNERVLVFDNCDIQNSSFGASSGILIKAEIGLDTNNKWIEFKNCNIQNSGGGLAFVLDISGINNQYLFTNNTFNISSGIGFILPNGTLAKVSMYSNQIEMDVDAIALQFGADTAIPTQTIGLIDLRSNTVRYLNNHYQHGLLLGRGVVNRYVVNNQIYVNAINNPLALGIVDKTIASQLTNSILKGNYVEAPRPYYIKGGKNNTVQYNSFISNDSHWEGFGFTNYKNGADEVLSQTNDVRYNNIIGNTYGIYLYPSTDESQDVVTTVKTNNINNNKYYFSTNYLYDGLGAQQIIFNNRSTFWDNDVNSSVLSLSKLPIQL